MRLIVRNGFFIHIYIIIIIFITLSMLLFDSNLAHAGASGNGETQAKDSGRVHLYWVREPSPKDTTFGWFQ